MKTIAILLAASAALSGCATVTGDSTQFVRLETLDENGQSVKGAKCTMQNDYGTASGESGGQINVHRSSKDLFIACQKDGYSDANATAVSRANAGMWGNIIIGGGIGAIIDHNKGTAYSYPEWMQLVFGKMLTFDRTDDKDGQPSLAKGPTVTPASAATNPPETATQTEIAAAK